MSATSRSQSVSVLACKRVCRENLAICSDHHILSSRPDQSQYLAMPRSRTSIARADTGWVAQQKQVFMKWMNSRLLERINEGKASPVNDLKKDLKDG